MFPPPSLGTSISAKEVTQICRSEVTLEEVVPRGFVSTRRNAAV